MVERTIKDFVTYVMEEATQNYYVSFRDGDPRETFFDSFNAHFEQDSHFNEMFLLMQQKIGEISSDDKKKMLEIENMCKGKRFIEQNKALAFFRVMNFYGNNNIYKQKYGKTIYEEMSQFRDGSVRNKISQYIDQ